MKGEQRGVVVAPGNPRDTFIVDGLCLAGDVTRFTACRPRLAGEVDRPGVLACRTGRSALLVKRGAVGWRHDQQCKQEEHRSVDVFRALVVKRDIAFATVAAFQTLLADVIVAGVLGAMHTNTGGRFATDGALKLVNRAGRRNHF